MSTATMDFFQALLEPEDPDFTESEWTEDELSHEPGSRSPFSQTERLPFSPARRRSFERLDEDGADRSA